MSDGGSSSDETVTLTILRTSDASKAQIDFSLSKSLNELKSAIAMSSFGPLSPNYQRLFCLGREIKKGGKSLSNLGVGKFHNYCLHLVSSQPETYDLLSSDDEEEEEEKVEIVQPPKRGSKTVIDLIDDSDDDEQEGKRQRLS